MWTIKAYCTLEGVCEVEEKISDASDDLLAEYCAAVEYLCAQPKQGWTRPRAAKLTKQKKNKFRDFYEIRFKAENVQQRPIGYFGPGSDDFTILIWAIEKGNALKPSAWHTTATRRMEKIKSGVAYAREIKVDVETPVAPKKKRLS